MKFHLNIFSLILNFSFCINFIKEIRAKNNNNKDKVGFLSYKPHSKMKKKFEHGNIFLFLFKQKSLLEMLFYIDNGEYNQFQKTKFLTKKKTSEAQQFP